MFVSSGLARCSNSVVERRARVKISCSQDANAVVRSVYVSPVALPNVVSLFASVITYQGGVALLVSGTSFPDEGRAERTPDVASAPRSRARSYMSASLVECVTPAVAPLQIALRVGFGATESVDLVQYGPAITVAGGRSVVVVDPPLWLTPATTYVSARSSRIRVADYQQLGALSVDALECEFGQHNFTAAARTNSAPDGALSPR